MPTPADFLPTRGRLGATIVFSITGGLTADDIYRVALTGDRARSGPPGIQTIRAIHHHAARLLAEGKTSKEVALVVGRTAQRISDLQKDPTFRELMAYYFDKRTDLELGDSARMHAKAVDIGELAMDELRERLEDPKQRAEMSAAEIRQIAAMTLDRTVLPPKVATQTGNLPTNITFNIAGRGIVDPAQAPTDITPVPAAVEHQPPEPSKTGDQGPVSGGAGEGKGS